MPKEQELNVIFQMKYGSAGAFTSYRFKLKWKGRVLENCQVATSGRRKARARWKSIDLSATTDISVNQDEHTIVLKHRGSNQRMVDISLRFEDPSTYTTWLYYIVVSLVKHAAGVVTDRKLDGMVLATEQRKKQTRLLKVKARRDRMKFDARPGNFLKARKSDYTHKKRAMDRDKVITGERGGKYRIGRGLGSGGQGLVFNAGVDVKGALCKLMGLDPDFVENWTPGEHPVVVKVAYYDGTDKVVDMVREARILASLGSHENIVKLLDVTIGNEAAYLILEKGDYTLDECAEKIAPFSNRKRLKIAAGILKGLDHMHQRSVYHHDIKPENILMFGEVPKLIDFGAAFSRTLGDFTKVTVATSKYSAPENPGSRNIVTQKDSPYAVEMPTKKREIAERYAIYDSFSVGLCFFECLLGNQVARGYSDDTYNVELSGTYKAQRYWHEKMKTFSTPNPMLRALADTALRLTAIDFRTRLSVHDALESLRTTFPLVVGLRSQTGERPDSRQVAQTLSARVDQLEEVVTS